ncbi:MAG: hypothetical protein GC179_11205 [Anaerolineaceae bacterium]|nr:hypothetical protein [Anaerolineaceae bacterium]
MKSIVTLGDGQELVSVITTSSVQRLNLQVGQSILVVIKSTEVMLATKTWVSRVNVFCRGAPTCAPVLPPLLSTSTSNSRYQSRPFADNKLQLLANKQWPVSNPPNLHRHYPNSAVSWHKPAVQPPVCGRPVPPDRLPAPASGWLLDPQTLTGCGKQFPDCSV